MSSRGSRAKNGHVTTNEYKIKSDNSYVYDAKVLVGQKNIHGLPDYSHTPNSKYIKENPDGSFREMRIYGNNGEPLIEIGYHCEESLSGNRHVKVLHYHTFDKNLVRKMGGRISETENSEIYNKYKKYLKEYGL